MSKKVQILHILDRFVTHLNHIYPLYHLLVFLLTLAAIPLLERVPSLTIVLRGYLPPGISGMPYFFLELSIYFSLALARTLVLANGGTLLFIFLASTLGFCFLILLFPQVVFWSIRRYKWRFLFLFILSLLMNITIFYINGFYASWSYTQICKYSNMTLPKSDFLRDCGYPLLWQRDEEKKIWYGIYSNGNFQKSVFFYDDLEMVYIGALSSDWP